MPETWCNVNLAKYARLGIRVALKKGDVQFVVETVSGLAGVSLQFEQAASEPVGIARVKPQCLVYVLGTVWLPSVSPTEILRSANSVEMTSASSGSMDRSSALISEGMSA